METTGCALPETTRSLFPEQSSLITTNSTNTDNIRGKFTRLNDEEPLIGDSTNNNQISISMDTLNNPT